jgi:hypothetical protein
MANVVADSRREPGRLFEQEEGIERALQNGNKEVGV